MRRFVVLAAVALFAVACGTNDPFGRGEATEKADEGGGTGATGGGTGGTGATGGGSGGGAGGAGGGGIGVSFTVDVDPILDAKCASCHAGGPGGLVITGDPSSDYDNVIDRVVPGDPDNSPLLTKGRGMSHGGGAILSEGDDDDSVIDAWISVGAPNN
ncbi:hypothetical protein [Vulgatibacter sp.]|uniref:hypothetical protein n=1 Tax=Vulgatibacter sp. TaxID=1971226 RepID=UPI0035646F02